MYNSHPAFGTSHDPAANGCVHAFYLTMPVHHPGWLAYPHPYGTHLPPAMVAHLADQPIPFATGWGLCGDRFR